MTRVDKCDVCRLRKVKCDEKKPKCGACLKGDRACTYSKGDRACTYSYGKPSAFVVEDPKQFSSYGKAKVAPLVYPIVCYEHVKSGITSRPKPALTEATENAENSCQISKPNSRPLSSSFPLSQSSIITSTSPHSNLSLLQLSSPESMLTARFIHLLGPHLQNPSPFVIDGLWAESIPARIGRSRVFDLAVEFAIDSFNFYRHATFSTRKVAMVSKGKALKALRLELQKMLSFDVLLAIKMHFHSEAFLDFTNRTVYHLHTKGLFKILKSGNAALSRDQDYWIFLHGTYIEEVIEATFMGRPSNFDNDFYLAATLFGSSSQSPPTIHSASMSLMHCWIQIPRLVCLVRQARSYSDISTLASAVSLAESLWTLDQVAITAEYFTATTEIVPLPAGQDISDIVPESLHFDSVYSLILLTRYWMFQVYLCGLTYSLRTYFPIETAASLLPNVDMTIQVDSSAATYIAQSLLYALSSCPSLPLVPFRILSPLQASVSSWHRVMVHSDGSSLSLTEAYDTAEKSCRSRRMIEWIMEESNRVHAKWGFPSAALWQLERAQEFINGGTEWHRLFPIESF